jgi:hypothetical protein
VHIVRCRLGDVLGSVPTTERKGRGFKCGLGDGLWRPIKIRSTPSFGWEVKPEVPCRKILRYVKDPLTYLRYWIRKIKCFVHSSSSLQNVFDGTTCREFWWTSQEFSPAGIVISTITMALHVHISPGGWTLGLMVAAVLRRKSCPIDVISQSVFFVWSTFLFPIRRNYHSLFWHVSDTKTFDLDALILRRYS